MAGIDENTILMLHGEDFVDSSFEPKAVMNYGSIINDNGKFGKCFMSPANTSQKRFKTDSLNLGSDNFTIDFWFKTSATLGANSQIFRLNVADESSYYCGIGLNGNTTGFIVPHISYSGLNWEISTGNIFKPDPNEWYHIALVREYTKIKTYVNGKFAIEYNVLDNSLYSKGESTFLTLSKTMNNSQVSSLYIDEFRVSNIARWTCDFTPPIEPYSVDPTAVVITNKIAEIQKGSTYQFNVEIVPIGVPSHDLIWQSNNQSIATVTDGLLKAVNVGTAQIMVSSKSNPSVSNSVILQVKSLESVEPESDYKITVSGVEHNSNDIYSLEINRSLFSGDKFQLGTAQSAACKVVFEPSINPPRNAEVRIAVKANLEHWQPLGTFYIDTRKDSQGVLTVECFDKMLFAERLFIMSKENREYPMTMLTALQYIVSECGFEVDESVQLNSNFFIEYPNELTMREVLMHIASAHAGSFYINNHGKLALWTIDTSSNHIITAEQTFDLIKGEPYNYSGIKMVWSEEGDYFLAGEEESVYEIYNPYATQAITNYVWGKLQSYRAVPYESRGAEIIPGIEIGSKLSVALPDGSNFKSEIIQMRFKAPSMIADVGYPIFNEIDSEFPYKGQFSRQIQSKVGLGSWYYGVSITRKNGLQIKRTDGLSEATFNSDVFEMSSLVDGVMKPAIYYDSIARKYKISGQVEIDGTAIAQTIIVNNLYAEDGKIANLTVNQLFTDYDRPARYLNGDKSTVNYIRVHDEQYEMITATYAGGTTHYNDSRGNVFYWIDDSYTRMDYAETDYPVMVYTYTELIKASWEFEWQGDTAIPVMTWGAGIGSGNNGKVRMWKDISKFVIEYTNDSGASTAALTLNPDGTISGVAVGVDEFPSTMTDGVLYCKYE